MSYCDLLGIHFCITYVCRAGILARRLSFQSSEKKNNSKVHALESSCIIGIRHLWLHRAANPSSQSPTKEKGE